MDVATLFSMGMFDQFTQPALLLNEGKITACNAAAHALGLCAGQSAPELPAEAAADFDLQLAGQERRVSAQHTEAGVLLVVLSTEGERAAAQTMLSVCTSLQAPLSALLGASASLLPAIEELEDEQLQRSAAGCSRAFYQLLRLRDHLRDFAAAQSNELRISTEKTELCAYFDEIYEKTESLCAELGVTLYCKTPPRQFYGQIDRARLEQAVYELLSNALKFTPRGGEIHMELLRLDDTMRFTLRDNGEGIRADALTAPGYESFSVLRDARGGLGLGIPLVRQIVQLHGGRLVLSSTDSGALAIISLPLKRPASALELRSPLRTVESAVSRRRELIVLSDVLPSSVYDSRCI